MDKRQIKEREKAKEREKRERGGGEIGEPMETEEKKNTNV